MNLLDRLAARIDTVDGRSWPRLAAWSYLPRPYDPVADRRRWCWQRPALCGRAQLAALPASVRRDLTAALERHLAEQTRSDR